MRKNQIKKHCRNCQGVFYRSPCYADRPFCSRECSAEHQHKIRTVLMCCPYCQKQFQRRAGRLGKFCSVKCAALFNAIPHNVTITCVVCGKPARRKKSEQGKYCSQACVITDRGKTWVIKSPKGVVYTVTNLAKFVRSNPDLFAGVPERKTTIAQRMCGSFKSCGTWLDWIMIKSPHRAEPHDTTTQHQH